MFYTSKQLLGQCWRTLQKHGKQQNSTPLRGYIIYYNNANRQLASLEKIKANGKLVGSRIAELSHLFNELNNNQMSANFMHEVCQTYEKAIQNIVTGEHWGSTKDEDKKEDIVERMTARGATGNRI